MTILVSSSNSLNPKTILETSKDLPRILPASMSTSWKFISFHGSSRDDDQDQTTKNIRRMKETNADKKKVKEEKGKRYFRMAFPVKKMTCVISSVFSRNKTLAGENREDHSAQETSETLAVGRAKLKQHSTEKKVSFWKHARARVKILILGQRLKTRKRRRSSREDTGEAELCKKRILMGERCKPMNRSGVLQYDGDGILLPDEP